MSGEITAIKEKVAPIASRYGIKQMYLFGSRARGDNRDDSDYDFLISSGDLKSLWKYIAFWTELEDTFHSSVDVISDTSFDQDIIRETRKDGLLIYERKE